MKKIKPYIKQNNRIVNNKKLNVKDIIIKKNFVKIVLEHWDFKWIQHVGTCWAEETHYEFGFNSFDMFINSFRRGFR
jgi:hypothetical protein